MKLGCRCRSLWKEANTQIRTSVWTGIGKDDAKDIANNRAMLNTCATIIPSLPYRIIDLVKTTKSEVLALHDGVCHGLDVNLDEIVSEIFLNN